MVFGLAQMDELEEINHINIVGIFTDFGRVGFRSFYLKRFPNRRKLYFNLEMTFNISVKISKLWLNFQNLTLRKKIHQRSDCYHCLHRDHLDSIFSRAGQKDY